jgi:hypothetical protein
MPVSIQFLGVGGAFSIPTVPGDLSTAPMQSNMVITSESGKCMLFDCGSDIRFSAQMCGYGPNSFDAVYISHEHADHTGGLEWLLLNRLFGGGSKPVLIAEAKLIQNLWKMLHPGLEVTTNSLMNFSDYVIEYPISYREFIDCGVVSWEGLQLYLVRQVHVPHKSHPMFSYGLTVWDGKTAAFHVSSDATFNPDRLAEIAEDVSIIFQDCEVGYKTGVHAHYDELLTLQPEVRAKMWLYHYNPNEAAKKDAVADGFLGFVQRGQTFTFD